MTRTHAVFLRAVSNVPIQPFREALEQLGLAEVGSFGGTGNLFFRAESLVSTEELEDRIGQAVGTEAFVRSRAELEVIVANDPYFGRRDAGLFIAKSTISCERADLLLEKGFEGPPPVVDGSVVYFVHPTRRPGRTTVVDFERELSVRGTMRGSSVVARVLELM